MLTDDSNIKPASDECLGSPILWGLNLVIASIGLLTLLGWVLEVPIFTTWKSGAIPMAPITAVLTLAFSLVFGFCINHPLNFINKQFALMLSWVGAMTALCLCLVRLMGLHLSLERLGLPITGVIDAAPIGYISIITAFCLFLAFVALITLSHQTSRTCYKVLSWSLSGLILLISLGLLLAYIFGLPLITNNLLINPALNTSFMLLLTGVGLLTLNYHDYLRQSATAVMFSNLPPYIIIFVIFSAGILTLAYDYYRTIEVKFRYQVESELLAVSKLKTDQLVLWRKERVGNAILSQNILITASIKRLLANPDSLSPQQEMQDWLTQYINYFGQQGYDYAYFLDTKGVTRLSIPAQANGLDAFIKDQALASMQTGEVKLQDFYRDTSSQRIYMALIVPLLDKKANNQALGAFVIRIDPAIFLYPLIESWPTPSTTAETLLVRKEGNQVLFLNSLRFNPTAALNLRFPLSNKELSSVKAVFGEHGIIEALNYRGAPVISVLKAIPDSPWFTITNEDLSEVYVPLQERLWLTLLLLCFLELGGGAMLFFIWRQQRLGFYQSQYKLTQALREKDEQHQRILDKAIDGFWLMNKQMQLLEVNETYCRMSAYTDQELKTMHVSELQTPETATIIETNLALGIERFESQHRRKDGRIFDVEVSIQYLPYGGGQFAAFFQDITERKKIEQALHHSKSFSLAILDSVLAEIAVLDNKGTIILTNHPWQEFAVKNALPTANATGGEIGVNYLQVCQAGLTTEIDSSALNAYEGIQAVLEARLPSFTLEYPCDSPQEKRWFRMIVTPLLPLGSGAVVTHSNITEHKLAEVKLQLAASVFTHAREGIMITDSEGQIIQVNDAFSEISGYTREEVLGKNPRIFSSGRQGKEFYTALWHDLTTKGHWYGEFWNRHKNGEVYAVMESISVVANSEDKSRQYVALMSDITISKTHEQALEHNAHYDALTDLPNRVLLSDRIQQAIAKSRRSKEMIALVFLDLDGFKAINDTHGHLAGDHLLIGVADNMSKNLREVDTLARIGGDEFVALLIDVGDILTSEPLFSRLLAAASTPVPFGEFVLQVSASMGITFYPQLEEVDVDILIRQADQAMYLAKQNGKNRYHVFDVDMDKLTRSHNEDLLSLREALAAGEFELYYQPKVNLRLGAIIGAEALIRWQHPVKGLIPPSEFLPLIENHPLSIDLGMWVINAAMEQIENWKLSGLALPLSINISALQLQQDDFIACLQAFLNKHPTVLPGDLAMEILETSAMKDLSKVSQLIEGCRKLGISFSLDDFGTGYSSLTYLKRLPISQLKIDQSFVRDMLSDIDDLAIVEGVLALAAAFNLEVIAEGMETIPQGEMLLQMGCDKAQGYAIARPMPAKDLENWIANWQPDPSWLDRPSFTRDDLPLLFANAGYKMWIDAIESYLNFKGPKPEKSNSRFDGWLNINSLLKDGDYTRLLTLHQELYAMGEQLVELHEAGQDKKALSRLPELHQLQKTLLKNLKIMVQKNWQ
jgi:diguanylate cyclase (GGDEF)-like protein/PAS domain S-box-containing protein